MLRFSREILLSLLVLWGLAACNDSPGPTAPPPSSQVPAVASIEVSPASASVLEGETVPFRAVVRNAQGEEIQAPGLLWRSADLLIAQVDAHGLAIALPQHGTTQIIAEIGGKQASGALTSRARCKSPAPVDGTRNPALPMVIVQVRQGTDPRRMAEKLAQKYGFAIDHIFEGGFGFTANLTYLQIAQVRCERGIESLAFDAYIPL
jgi:hypothetical protein